MDSGLFIRQFHEGDVVYVLENQETGEMREMVVQKTGRKYIYVSGDMKSLWQRRFGTDWNTDVSFLKEMEAGKKALLFRTERELSEYLEKRKLRQEIHRKIKEYIWFSDSGTTDWYTLEQLREIDRILNQRKE